MNRRRELLETVSETTNRLGWLTFGMSAYGPRWWAWAATSAFLVDIVVRRRLLKRLTEQR